MLLTVAQGTSSKKLDHDTLKANIKLMATVQTDHSMRQPLDIVEMWYHDEDVKAVGMQKGKGPTCLSCWTCGGSQSARSCPKGQQQRSELVRDGRGQGKGKGKSSGPIFGSCHTCGGNHESRECSRSDGGAGGNKGGGKSNGKASKCFNCGGIGHRAAECPTPMRALEETWRRIRTVVIYNKCYVEEAGNYRPKRSLPALYKLFLTLLHNRLYSRLDREQPADQGGCCGLDQTLDRQATYRLLEKRLRFQNVGRDGGLRESVRHALAHIAVDCASTIRYRAAVHQPPEEAICRSDDGPDRQRE